jgi:type IV secretion system protein VirB10
MLFKPEARMADDLGAGLGPAGDAPEPAGSKPPPPLSSIRVKPPGARGLNKKAVVAVAGGALAIILVVASNGLSANGSKKPADVKPMMSDPVRPEIAQSNVAQLPASYDKVPKVQFAAMSADTPVLGKPLPGDVAAFAPNGPAAPLPAAAPAPVGPQPAQTPSPAQSEADQAQRSGLFFALREPAKASGPQQRPPTSPLQALASPQQLAQVSASNDRALFPGAVIPASLVTAIDSEAPGPAIAQITQSIYDSATGRTLLIPQGARLIGEYKSAAKFGQSRVAVLWSRLIMPDGREINLDLPGLDPAGSGGVPGKVDNHWAEVFGAAALGTLINIGVAATEQQPSLGVGGIGVITNEDPSEAAVRQGVERTASAVTSRVVDRSLAIPPTIRVAAGTKISVIVTRRSLL